MENLTRTCLILICVQLLLLCCELETRSVVAQLTIDAQTPYSSSDGTPNTVIGAVGDSVASSLLDSGTNTLLWGVVSSDSVNAVCQQISDYGIDTVTATVNHNWGDGPESLTFQVTATGGCLAASDGSGTEIVSVDQYNHQNAIVCPDNAGENGCVIWISGPDVDQIYNGGMNDGSNNNITPLDDSGCTSGAETGISAGYAAGKATGSVICDSAADSIPILGSVPAGVCTGVVTAVAVVIGGGIGCVFGVIIQQACFPGDALVQLEGGQILPIMHLEIGHRVAVWEPSISKSQTAVTYDEVYALGHKDEFAKSSFYKISMRRHVLYESESGTAVALDSHLWTKNSTRTLEISAQHFLPTMQSAGTGGKRRILHKRAKDIRVGDYLWAASDLDESRNDSTALVQRHIVTSILVVYKKGLYNPLTLSGNIVVNGVVASVHSDWFLDNVFSKFGLPSSILPYLYQAVLAPPRMLYRMWPRQFYLSLYNWLNTQLSVQEWYGAATLISATATVALILCRFLYHPPPNHWWV